MIEKLEKLKSLFKNEQRASVEKPEETVTNAETAEKTESGCENRERMRIAKEFAVELERTPKGDFYKKLKKIAAVFVLAGFLVAPAGAIAAETTKEQKTARAISSSEINTHLQEEILKQIRERGGILLSAQQPEIVYRSEEMAEKTRKIALESEVPFYSKPEVILGKEFVKNHPEKTKEYMGKISTAIKASVMLENLDSKVIGSGVIIKTKEGKCLILTNRHVCESFVPREGGVEGEVILKNGQLKANFSNKKTSGVCKILAKSEKSDLAALELPKSEKLDELLIGTEALEVDEKSDLKTGEKVASVGNPLSFPFAVAMNEIEKNPSDDRHNVIFKPDERFRSLELYFYKEPAYGGKPYSAFKGDTLSGMSGSPLISLEKEGKSKLAGLIFSAYIGKREHIEIGTGAAVPAEDIIEFLNEAGL